MTARTPRALALALAPVVAYRIMRRRRVRWDQRAAFRAHLESIGRATR